MLHSWIAVCTLLTFWVILRAKVRLNSLELSKCYRNNFLFIWFMSVLQRQGSQMSSAQNNYFLWKAGQQNLSYSLLASKEIYLFNGWTRVLWDISAFSEAKKNLSSPQLLGLPRITRIFSMQPSIRKSAPIWVRKEQFNNWELSEVFNGRALSLTDSLPSASALWFTAFNCLQNSSLCGFFFGPTKVKKRLFFPLENDGLK